MSAIVVFFEHKDGKILGASLSALTAAKSVAESKNIANIVGIVVGPDGQQVAETLKQYGLAKAYFNTAASYVAAPYAAIISEVTKKEGADIFVAAASSVGKDLLPAVAVSIDAAMASDILSVVKENTYTRGMYAGNVIAEIEISHPQQVISVRSTAFPHAPTVAETPSFIAEEVQVQMTAQATVTGFKGSRGERPDLGDAKIVVSGGRGLQSKEGFEQYIFPLADTLGAAVGASRAAVDAGFVPNDWQVGQTGRTVAPALYIGVGISGAIQHIAGMKDSKTIVAINKDPEAPIFEVADYGLVGDLTKIVPELIAELKK